MGTTQYAETLAALVERTGRTRSRPRGRRGGRAGRDGGVRRRVGLPGLGPDGSVVDALLRGRRRHQQAGGAVRAGTQALAGVPAQPPLLPRPAGAAGGHGRARLPQQLHARRDQPRHVAALGAREAERADLHPPLQPRRPGLPRDAAALPRVPAAPARQPRVVLRGRPHPHRQAASTADGGAALPRRRLPRQRRDLRRRLPRAGLDRLRPAARGLGPLAGGERREQGAREPDLALPLRPRPRPSPRARPRAVRPAAVAARGPGRRRLARGDRRPHRGGASRRVRGGAPHQRRHADHPGRPGDVRTARQRRSRDDPGRDARRPRTARRLRTSPPAAAHRRRRPRAPRGSAQGAGDAGPRGRRGRVRRWARARLLDRARPSARGGVLSQHRHPLLHRPRDPRGGAGAGGRRLGLRRGRRRRGHLDARPGPARPAQVRVLLRDQGRVRRPSCATRPTWSVPAGPRRATTRARSPSCSRTPTCCWPTG